jgi:predicted PhzF superfamily epimerase YddE/YHI9
VVRSIPFVQVDAFADAPFTGNPAAVLTLDHWLEDDVLQVIAAENNLAETAFSVPLPEGDTADYALRWFTPTVEVALCGHATLATGHVLLGEREMVRFRTQRAGDLIVTRAGDALALDLPSWAPSPKPLPEMARHMGGPVLETYWQEGGYAVFVYPDEQTVRALTPNFAAMRPSSEILFIATATGAQTDIVSRVFAPGAGVDEDPVTGAAHCIITSYWAERLGRTDFSAYQASKRGGRLHCALRGDRVVLTGACRTMIRGAFLL